MKFSIFVITFCLVTISASSLANKVHVGVYYESMCPGCREEFIKNLGPAIKNIGEYMDVELVPYGNARTSGNQVHCQHGQNECYGNAAQACVLHREGFKKGFQFAYCMFHSSYYNNPHSSVKECAQQMGLNYIEHCASSEEGNRLLIEMGRKTVPHKYVPWTTVNGKFTNEDLTDYICRHFLDRSVPACNRRNEAYCMNE